MMSASTAKPSSPLAPDTPSDKPEVVFKTAVLKLGMDGSSLPRLVVVTDSNVYICLSSGGITRTIAVPRIERVTLCPRDVMNDEDAHKESPASTAAKNHKDNANTSTPPSNSKLEKKTRSKSPSSFFASMFSRGGRSGSGSRAKSSSAEKRSSSKHGRDATEDVDETHPASPRSDASSAVMSQEVSQPSLTRRGSSAYASTTERGSVEPLSTAVSSTEWAVIATLGIAFEPPLALQFLRAEDGEGFVSALRASPFISEKAVFNMPDEDGPTNAAGVPLFSTPARREDPVVPRVLERDRDDQSGGGGAKLTEERVEVPTVVEEVELSPSSPRSTTAAMPPQAPLSNYATLQAQADEEESEADTDALVEEKKRESTTSSAVEEKTTPSREEDASVPSSPPAPASAFSSSSSKASSVHTAEPDSIQSTTATDNGAAALRTDVSKPVVVLTPLKAELSDPPQPAPLRKEDKQTQQRQQEKPMSAVVVEAPDGKDEVAEEEGHTPSPLRAAPHREAPQPPLQPVAPTPFVSFPQDEAGEGPTPRTLYKDTAEIPLQAAVTEKEERRTTPSLWETIRDSRQGSEQRSSPTAPYTASPALTTSLANDKGGNATRAGDAAFSTGAEQTAAQSMNRPSLPSDKPAFEASSRPAPPAGLNATQHTPARTTDTNASVAAAASAAASAMQPLRTPHHVDTFPPDVAEQTETMARLRRSLQAQEALLLELSDAKAEVQALRTALAERDAQCAEWQSAYAHVEAHVGRLRREQEHLLGVQEEKLRHAHRAELEAVQAAFEEYDARMTDFVAQLQRDHREEAAQWQHERRTLHHQLEEQYQRARKEEEEEVREEVEKARAKEAAAAARARTVADGAAREARQRQQQRASPPSPAAAAYLDPINRSSARMRAPAEADNNARGYESARERVQEKLDVYVAQRQRRRQPPAPSASPPPPPQSVPHQSTAPTLRDYVRSPPALSNPIAGSSSNPSSASPWPQPRSAQPSPAAPVVAFGAHRLYDNFADERAGPATSAGMGSSGGGGALVRRRDPRVDSLIQTPPSSSLEYDGERGNAQREAGGYALHRRTYI